MSFARQDAAMQEQDHSVAREDGEKHDEPKKALRA